MTLDQALIDDRLIDEFRFSRSGRRLFEGVDTSRLKLRLTHSQKTDNGIVALSYVIG